MNREKKISAYALIILAGSLVALISLSMRSIAAGNIISLFNPPLTNKEIAQYKKIGDNKKEIQKFIETRLFLRKLASFVAEIPKGVEYDPVKHGSPQPSTNVDMKYSLTFDEQLALFNSCLLCGGCGDKEENKPTDDPNCGLSHPKQFDCGKPVDRSSVISQLSPPVSQEEISLFEKANKCPSPEIPRFLATRKYMRQINKLMAGSSSEKKFDPRTAPPIPDLIDSSYFLHGEVFIMMDIQNAQLLDNLSPKR